MSTNGNQGTLLEIKGVVVDAVFPDGLPEIYSALSITRPDGSTGPGLLQYLRTLEFADDQDPREVGRVGQPRG